MRCLSFSLAALLLAPGVAVAGPVLNTASVFSNANILMQALMLALIVATIAAVGVTAAKVARGSRLAGGSAFVSALRLGGPLLGLLGAVYTLLMTFIGIANFGGDVPMGILSPGFAEASLLFLLGLFAGVVGVVCHWVIEARIDRTVLRQ